MESTRRKQSKQEHVYQAEAKCIKQQHDRVYWMHCQSMQCALMHRNSQSPAKHMGSFVTGNLILIDQCCSTKVFRYEKSWDHQMMCSNNGKVFVHMFREPSNCMYQSPPNSCNCYVVWGNKSIFHEHWNSVGANQPLDFPGFQFAHNKVVHHVLFVQSTCM